MEEHPEEKKSKKSKKDKVKAAGDATGRKQSELGVFEAGQGWPEEFVKTSRDITRDE